jgi:hypothetical protein
MSILSNLKDYAKDEGLEAAIAKAQFLQSALETIMEIGEKHEQSLCSPLLRTVNKFITSVVDDALKEAKNPNG